VGPSSYNQSIVLVNGFDGEGTTMKSCAGMSLFTPGQLRFSFQQLLALFEEQADLKVGFGKSDPLDHGPLLAEHILRNPQEGSDRPTDWLVRTIRRQVTHNLTVGNDRSCF
jgi:hypothetical protein